MPKPMQCSPSLSINADGQEVLDYNNPNFGNQSGFSSDSSDFYLNESTGEVTYNHIADPTKPQDSSFDETDYYNTLAEAYPMEQLHAFAQQELGDQNYAAFLHILENGDMEQVNSILEEVNKEYEQYLADYESSQESEEQAPVEDLSDFEVQAIQEKYDTEGLLDWMTSNFDQDVLDAFDQVVEVGSLEQIDQIYGLLEAAYQNAQGDYE